MIMFEIFYRISKKRKKVIQNNYSFSDISIVAIKKVKLDSLKIYLFAYFVYLKSVYIYDFVLCRFSLKK